MARAEVWQCPPHAATLCKKLLFPTFDSVYNQGNSASSIDFAGPRRRSSPLNLNRLACTCTVGDVREELQPKRQSQAQVILHVLRIISESLRAYIRKWGYGEGETARTRAGRRTSRPPWALDIEPDETRPRSRKGVHGTIAQRGPAAGRSA